MQPFNPEAIPLIRGKKPASHEAENAEMAHYESGTAEMDAAKVSGPFSEPWLNVVHAYEPVSMPSYDKILEIPELRKKIKGRVLDIAAGSCWLSGKLTKLSEVDEVFSVDLSENFLKTAGVRCMQSLGADLSKSRLVVTDFNHLPIETGTADCAFLFAALHHSLSPIKTLQEIGRSLRPGGVIMILENPPAVIHIRKCREKNLAIETGVSEIAYTREELEYVMKSSKVGPLKVFTFDILARPGWRFWIRKLFRRFQLEHIFLNPPTYLFVIEKK